MCEMCLCERLPRTPFRGLWVCVSVSGREGPETNERTGGGVSAGRDRLTERTNSNSSQTRDSPVCDESMKPLSACAWPIISRASSRRAHHPRDPTARHPIHLRCSGSIVKAA